LIRRFFQVLALHTTDPRNGPVSAREIVMNTFKTFAEIDGQRRLVVEDVPFPPGALVEVMLVDSHGDTADADRWWAFFKSLQARSQARGLTDADIQAEIDAYRSGE